MRRYITILQDVGIPVEANIGRYGGYRLRPGIKLPPLLFTEEEATAIMLGLLGTSWLEIGQSSMAIEGALAKVSRVLPLRNEVTRRKVEPYGIVGWEGHWYLVGYCCLRQGIRTFRLDRMQQVRVLAESFVKAEDFDCHAYMIEQYAKKAPARWQIEVEFQAALFTVQQKIPASYGSLTDTPTGVLFQSQYDDLASMARYLMVLNLPFVVHQPAELREALLRLAEQMVQSATVPLAG